MDEFHRSENGGKGLMDRDSRGNRGSSGNRHGGFNRGNSGGRGFGGNRGRSSGGFRNNGFNRGPREMHKAVCADCKKECEVPFKPTEGKPVYCRDCFQKHKSY